MKLKTLVMLFAVLALMASACGAAADKISEKAVESAAEKAIEEASGGQANVDISGSEDAPTIKVETEEGSVAFGAGVDMPEEITIPVPDGGTVQSAMSFDDGSAQASVAYDRDRYDELVSFYEDWVVGNGGDSWQKQTQSMETDDDTIRQTYWFDDESGAAIGVMDCAAFGSAGDGLDAACVSISQGGA